MSGIYVHIPFCRAKCAYCDFYSVARTDYADAFADAVEAEWLRRRGDADDGVRTVYFGGGTPSALSDSILKRLTGLFPMSEAGERTIEVNPEDVSAERAAAWADMGFNRVSMGVQSLNDSELAAVRRRHDAAGALRAIDTLRHAGFGNISCDLIYGLPGQTPASFAHSLDVLLGTGIEHLSAYLLSYEPGTLLSRRLANGEISEANDATVFSMYGILREKAAAAGMEHYEISNFARPGFHSRHNSSYWNLTPYLGLGPGAHSLGPDGVRTYNPGDLQSYLSQKDISVAEEESHAEKLDDLIIISLRTASGLDLGHFRADEKNHLLDCARPFIMSGELLRQGETLRIPAEHWLRADAIMRELLFC